MEGWRVEAPIAAPRRPQEPLKNQSKIQLVLGPLFGPILEPKIGPKWLQNRSRELPKTLLQPGSCWMPFPEHFFVRFSTPLDLKKPCFFNGF